LTQINADTAASPDKETTGQPSGGAEMPMTTIAMLPRPLERLFDRIDAADPSDPYLRALLETWRAQRLERFLPPPEALIGMVPEPAAGQTFNFACSEPPVADWVLVEAGAVARSIFGSMDGNRGLADMRSRRLAVHLRRLFDLVRETAEPVAASFSERGLPFDGNRFEVVAAPLSSDGRQVDGIFGGIVARE
jgi:ribose-phosphate pyrophosphokinase